MRIYMRKEDRKSLIEKLGISKTVCSDALAFKRDSMLCRRIRAVAMNQLNGIFFN